MIVMTIFINMVFGTKVNMYINARSYCERKVVTYVSEHGHEIQMDSV